MKDRTLGIILMVLPFLLGIALAHHMNNGLNLLQKIVVISGFFGCFGAGAWLVRRALVDSEGGSGGPAVESGRGSRSAQAVDAGSEELYASDQREDTRA